MNKAFSTSDFCLATTLVSLGFPILQLDRTDPRRVNFVFADQKDLQEEINLFWEEKTLISPMAFYYAQKKLKSLLYMS